MNTENIILALIGLVGAFLIMAALIWLYLRSWMQRDCRAQGPDFIRRHLMGQVVLWVVIALVLLVVLVVLDRLVFSQHGTVMNVVRKVPGLDEWGDLGVVALPLWGGSFLGLLLGAFAGVFAAVYGIPKRNHKCRRVIGLFSSS